LVINISAIIFSWILTYLIPQGQYQRITDPDSGITEGMIMDTLVYSLFSPLQYLTPAISGFLMMVSHALLHFPIPSYTGASRNDHAHINAVVRFDRTL